MEKVGNEDSIEIAYRDPCMARRFEILLSLIISTSSVYPVALPWPDNQNMVGVSVSSGLGPSRRCWLGKTQWSWK